MDAGPADTVHRCAINLIGIGKSCFQDESFSF